MPSVTMTVLIVDDHPTFRSFARDLLQSDGFEVIGEAENGSSAIEGRRRCDPKSSSWT